MSAGRFKPASSLGRVRGGETLFYGWLGPQRRLWFSAYNSTRIKRSCPCRSPRLSGTCPRISIALVDSVYRPRLLAHLSQAKQLPRVRLLSEKTKPIAQGAKNDPEITETANSESSVDARCKTALAWHLRRSTCLLLMSQPRASRPGSS